VELAAEQSGRVATEPPDHRGRDAGHDGVPECEADPGVVLERRSVPPPRSDSTESQSRSARAPRRATAGRTRAPGSPPSRARPGHRAGRCRPAEGSGGCASTWRAGVYSVRGLGECPYPRRSTLVSVKCGSSAGEISSHTMWLPATPWTRTMRGPAAALHGVQDVGPRVACTLLTRTINHRKNLVGDPGRGGTGLLPRAIEANGRVNAPGPISARSSYDPDARFAGHHRRRRRKAGRRRRSLGGARLERRREHLRPRDQGARRDPQPPLGAGRAAHRSHPHRRQGGGGAPAQGGSRRGRPALSRPGGIQATMER
jgi:hypothetical protein